MLKARRWLEAFATSDNQLFEEIIPRYSCLLQIVTDNGTENENRVMRETLYRQFVRVC